MSGVFPATITKKSLQGTELIPTAGGHLISCQGSNCALWIKALGKPNHGYCSMPTHRTPSFKDPIVETREIQAQLELELGRAGGPSIVGDN